MRRRSAGQNSYRRLAAGHCHHRPGLRHPCCLPTHTTAPDQRARHPSEWQQLPHGNHPDCICCLCRNPYLPRMESRSEPHRRRVCDHRHRLYRYNPRITLESQLAVMLAVTLVRSLPVTIHGRAPRIEWQFNLPGPGSKTFKSSDLCRPCSVSTIVQWVEPKS